jgi:ribonuclease VapC
MFLDASVIVACLVGEPEEQAIYDALENESRLATSPVSVFEVSSRIAVLWGVTIISAHDAVMQWLLRFDVTILVISDAEMRAAHVCASHYHKTTRHRARLNMGDCFAYASARTQALKLAYKGDDFSHTDVDGVRFGG